MILYLMYFYVFFMLVDWYDDYMTPSQKNFTFWVRPKKKLFFYLLFQVLKKGWLRFCFSFAIGIIFCVYKEELLLPLLLLALSSLLSPYLY